MNNIIRLGQIPALRRGLVDLVFFMMKHWKNKRKLMFRILPKETPAKYGDEILKLIVCY